MAGDWIPMRTDLWDCPEVVRILSAMCPDSVRDLSERVRFRSTIIGAMFRTWALFDTYTDDGTLHGYTADALDAAVGIEGWAANLQHVGWLIVNEQSLEMPGFTTYLSSSAKARLKDAQRKRNTRQNASVSRPESVRELPDKNRTTEEKRIEEKSKRGAAAPAPPSLEEVLQFVSDERLSMDGTEWYDHYAARGWVLSRGGPMVDWRAACRSWAHKESKFNGQPETVDQVYKRRD